MPIFKSNKIVLPNDTDHATIETEIDNDSIKMKHVQQIDDILAEAKLLRNLDNNGFSEERTMRKIATIPAAEFVKHPEWAYDKKALIKWLKSEDGKPYCTVRKGI